MILERHANETLEAFLTRIEQSRNMADLQAIEAAKILHVKESPNLLRESGKGFDDILEDIHRFRNRSRALTQLAIDVEDQIKTERFVEKWERANK